MRIAVVDGQGGGLGIHIVEKLSSYFGGRIHIIALGTNAIATTGMIKAGANEGATGENAIVHNAGKVDIIIGPIGVIAANAMLGEVTPKMAEAIATSSAKKFLLPLNKCNIEIVGVSDKYSLTEMIQIILDRVDELISN